MNEITLHYGILHMLVIEVSMFLAELVDHQVRFTTSPEGPSQGKPISSRKLVPCGTHGIVAKDVRATWVRPILPKPHVDIYLINSSHPANLSLLPLPPPTIPQGLLTSRGLMLIDSHDEIT